MKADFHSKIHKLQLSIIKNKMNCKKFIKGEFSMQNEMTAVSRKIYEEATSGLLTVREAIDFLDREAKIRTLREKLEKFSHGKDLRTTLVNGLMQHHPNLSKDAIERRVRGWLNNKKNESVRKSDAIEICFILELSVEEADAFVALISEEGLHWRNPDEIAYIFALKQGMSYSEAQELDKQMAEILSEAKDLKTIPDNSFTPIIRSEITELHTKEELIDYLQQEALRFGKYHNNAYKLFMEMMDILEHPKLSEEEEKAEVFEEEKLTIREILKEYLYEKNVLYAKEIARASKKNRSLSEEEKLVFSVIQEKVSSSWPDETTISKMKSRKADVTRKVLILLFLATAQDLGSEEEADYDLLGEEYLEEELEYEPTRDEVFKNLYQQLNDMLIQCGFSVLDPRSPFDWLILYCICAEDMFDLDIRMREVFKEMFGERN